MGKPPRATNKDVSTPSLESMVNTVEMPRWPLTRKEIQRLGVVDQRGCQLLLDSLLEVGFLSADGDGGYARASDGEQPPPRREKMAGVLSAHGDGQRPDQARPSHDAPANRQQLDHEQQCILLQYAADMHSTLAQIIKTLSERT